MVRTRTNIELEDDDVARVMERYRLRTKTEAVALALRHLAGQPMTRDEALGMRGAHAIDPIPEDDLDLLDPPIEGERVEPE
ncbi:type II toxin-antitoxin system VapB family antitoxin [Egibacter rhizosphaerae]|uniref:Type II toxin-antitoxin system VapB family antitoxin n=1 Tax=Egibacter rhizosphaerae TaxID=1670831 RepID=A0A411YIH2_9ACTN|nr:type II toxin-antitoxin system VapB family antitoxin [Egibacter rhizosphaerae]QBI20872.1 type II toxin-antitoxin system VapB family antitoxin [Egibacter rhizosphaerae]